MSVLDRVVIVICVFAAGIVVFLTEPSFTGVITSAAEVCIVGGVGLATLANLRKKGVRI